MVNLSVKLYDVLSVLRLGAGISLFFFFHWVNNAKKESNGLKKDAENPFFWKVKRFRGKKNHKEPKKTKEI